MMLRLLRRFRLLRCLLVLVVVLTLSVFLSVPPLYGQGGGNPTLQITKIDATNFPNMKIYLQGDNLGPDWVDLPIAVYEDGQQVQLSSSQTEQVGTQSALVLDASGSILDAGLTGKPRFAEVGDVTARLIELNILSTEADWLAAYAQGPSGNLEPLQDWTRDHQAVVNQWYLYQPSADIAGQETPLYDLIYFALDRFEKSDVPDNTAKKIVLFSDGERGSSSLRLDDAVRRAAEENIPIYPVLLGPGTEETKDNMRRIGTLTGGQAYQITSVDALDGLWGSLIKGREQRTLTYRSTFAQPTELLASMTLTNGIYVEGKLAFPAVAVPPVQVQIIQPAGNQLTITKEAPEFNTPLVELAPSTMTIQVDLSWPDGRPRNLERVEYWVNGHVEMRLEEPFNQIVFPITRLDSGNYTIRVIGVDDLGVKGESLPVTFTVDVKRPALVGAAISIFGFQIPLALLDILIMCTALGLSVSALVIAIRKPAVRERVTNAVTGAIRVITEPFFFDEQAKQGEIKATLTVEDRGQASFLPPAIEIRSGTTRIGRLAEYANIVIDDPRVSRYHCRINEEADGKLSLYDEGASSGTYVNYNPVNIDGQLLQSGDLINLGPVQLRFHYKSDYQNSSTDPFMGVQHPNGTPP